MELRLPKDFFMGAAMSGPQTEGAYRTGGKLENIWDTWSDLSISDFYNKVGSYVGNNFYEKYEEDIKLFKSLGLDSFRTSIQWSRLMDQDQKLNPEGADFYHKVCACAKEQRIELFMNLYHFDMPAYLYDRGGWENREVVEAYAVYARTAFREFGKEIRYCANRKEVKDHGDTGILLGSKLKDGDRVVIIEDVTTSGKSIEETYPVIKAQADVEIKGLMVSLNRMEKGQTDKSALEEIKEKYGFEANAIVNMGEVVEYLYNKPYKGQIYIDDGIKKSIDGYYEKYGAGKNI